MQTETYTIAQICTRFSSGKNITSAQIRPTGSYPVYGGNGLRGYTEKCNFDGECAIIGRQGAYCGNVLYVSGKAYMSEHAIVAVTSPEHNCRYLAYKLGLAQLGRFSGQAAQPGLSVKKLSKLRIEMPTLPIQRKIASILSSYDSLIEANTRRIRLLEQMAEKLYKEWFVRFRFPGHEKVKMVDGLPEGWRTKKYEDVTQIIVGGDKPQITSMQRTEVLCIPIYSNGTDENGLYGYTNEAKIETPCITVSARGTVGFVAIHRKPFYPIVRLLSVIPMNQTINEFYLYYFSKFAHLDGNGAAQQQLTSPMLKKKKILIPTQEILQNFRELVEKYFNYIDNLQCQSSLLSRQRDLLLPRLMSGKLEITL